LGDPYDPSSFAASWRAVAAGRSYESIALARMGEDAGGVDRVTKAALDQLITGALAEMDSTRRQLLWTQILTAVNTEAVFAPLTFMSSRAVVRPEVAGFAFGFQQVREVDHHTSPPRPPLPRPWHTRPQPSLAK
jgi:ABC-type transport system substrate-binding protein